MPDTPAISLNGIDGRTGGPAFEAPTVADLAARFRELAGLGSIGTIGHGGSEDKPHRDAASLAKSGWAVIVPKGLDPAIRRAIEPLCARRAAQAKGLYKEIELDPSAEDVEQFLARHGVSFGNFVAESLPKYLLFLGPPSLIPFEFQTLLGLEYGPGRLDLPTVDAYAAYASSVVAYESGGEVPTAREICFWGPKRDPATELSTADLLVPLARGDGRLRGVDKDTGALATAYLEEDATKERLLAELHRPSSQRPPSMLFTASHGLSYPLGDDLQAKAQGALVTADWYPGLPMSPDTHVAASDIGDDARIHGMVAFLFACFGAATPAFDSFPRDRSAPPKQLANAPFVSALPQRLLSHPSGGALGVFGHIDRAWGYSMKRASDIPQIGPFRTAILSVLGGAPLGEALADFARRAAGLSSSLVSRMASRAAPSDRDLAMRFIEQSDAAGYVLLGDPGASLRQGAKP